MHVVIVGLGSIGRRHATNVATVRPDARLTFVRHHGGEDDFARRLRARVVGSIDDVELTSCDLAILATPSDRHVDALPTLIRAGCPLMIEKPVVTDLDDCDTIESLLAESPPARRTVGFNLRYLPSLRRVRDLIDAGRLGRIVRASFTAGQWLPSWRPDVDYRTVYSAASIAGGGVELDLAHEFDIARWWLGDLAPLFAAAGTFSGLDISTSDTATSVLVPPGGRAPLVTVTLDYVARPRIRRYEVVGDAGTVQWSVDGSLRVETDDGSIDESFDDDGFDVGATYRTMLEAMLAPADGARWPSVQSVEDGLATTRLALAVRRLGAAA